jgi:transposase
MQLDYRAARFEDMSSQLENTIELQKFTRELAKERAKSEKSETRTRDLKKTVLKLKKSRRSAPPLIKIEGKRVTLNIPFLSPDVDLLKTILPPPSTRRRKAGVDRGLRHSMVVSIKNGEDTYEEKLIGRQELYEKREVLRQQTRVLMSLIAGKRNNWDKKHARLQSPAIILKKEQELESVWQKVRRLDKEISHQVAAETVWFCEYRGVNTIYFEDLRSFQGRGGMRGHSWNLSTNLWGMMIEGVRDRREAMGYRNGGVWLVNPAWTSQTCHVCGGQGIRVEDETSIIEAKGGEYFHCPKCDEHFHADINAARNIMYVQQSEPSAVSGRTT